MILYDSSSVCMNIKKVCICTYLIKLYSFSWPSPLLYEPCYYHSVTLCKSDDIMILQFHSLTICMCTADAVSETRDAFTEQLRVIFPLQVYGKTPPKLLSETHLRTPHSIDTVDWHGHMYIWYDFKYI